MVRDASHWRLAALALGLCGALVHGAPPQPVTLRTFDELELAADFYPAGRSEPAPCVILLHDLGADRRVWADFAPTLAHAGWNALAIDLRGHGPESSPALRQSALEQDPQTLREMFQDVRAAYDWLAPRPEVDRARFALIGEGLGASVAVAYAAEDRSVDALILLAPRGDQPGLAVTEHMRRIQNRRVELISGPATKAAAEGLARGAGVKASLVAPKPGSARLMGAAPRLEQTILRILKESAAGPSDAVVYASINSDVYHLAGSGWIEAIKPSNLRVFSSVHEAEARGLRRAKSRRPSDFRGSDKP